MFAVLTHISKNFTDFFGGYISNRSISLILMKFAETQFSFKHEKQITNLCYFVAHIRCFSAFKREWDSWNRVHQQKTENETWAEYFYRWREKEVTDRITAERSHMGLKGPNVALLSPWLNYKQFFSSIFCLYNCQSKWQMCFFPLNMAPSCHLGSKPVCVSTWSLTNDSHDVFFIFLIANISPQVFISL